MDLLALVLEEDTGVDTHTLKNDDDNSDDIWPAKCPCPGCPAKTLFTPEGLDLHVNECHPKGQVVVSNDSKTVTCLICKDKTLYNYAEYDAHLLKYHPTFDLKDSPKEKTLLSLLSTPFIKNKKGYPTMNCPECEKDYSSTRLWVHLKAKHNYEMENFKSDLFKCNICECNNFATVNDTRRHNLTMCQTILKNK